MREVDAAALPYPVEHTEHVWIPMPDGIRLAARLWRPADADVRPVPAIVEYIPYRKRDLTRRRDSMVHPYLAGHGYACVRVDLRGSGDSEGILLDQYRQQEQDDGVAVIEWLARQPWCDGSVGMMGISWGGFNALQIAAARPGPLKAIVTVCSTDDLYRDNMHYMGGCLLSDNLSEATTMFSVNSCPPDPELVGERWRGMWIERLEDSGLWLDTWLTHQHRDAYWRHGSVREDYGAIRCPVLAVGGWADGYTNAVFRLLAHLEVPRLGLVGPWGHRYPHLGLPGPAIGFLQEALRGWDHWLKGTDTGVMREPMLRVWLQDSVPPFTSYAKRPGRWVGEPSWPSPNVVENRYALVGGGIEMDVAPGPPDPRPPRPVSLQSPLSVGLFAGKWCSYSAAPDLPYDQREEDGGSLVYQSEPLSVPIAVLGAPELEVELDADQPVAMIAVRLSDVAPDDRATRITYGLLNLTHRHGHENPEPLVPGERYRVVVRLNHIGQVFPRGHRIRVSISTSYWPLVWPPPQPVRLCIHPQSSALWLPVRAPRDDDALIAFAEPEATPAIAVSQLEPAQHNWLVHRDLARNESTLEVIKDEGVYRIEDIDLVVGDRTWDWYTCCDNDGFGSMRGETRTERSFARGPWQVRTTTRTVLTADQDYFYIQAELDGWERDRRVYSRNWASTIPRKLV
jgi:uncharacterized protein